MKEKISNKYQEDQVSVTFLCLLNFCGTINKVNNVENHWFIIEHRLR